MHNMLNVNGLIALLLIYIHGGWSLCSHHHTKLSSICLSS